MLEALAPRRHRPPGTRAMISSSLTPAADPLRIPASARALDGFRRWARSPEFPETGRIDYLAGELEVEMSPEDLYTHGAPKAEIAAALQELIARSGLGAVFVDRARVTVPEAGESGLSAEPDVTVVLWETLDSGRVREIPSAGGAAGRFIELQGPPDLIVEVVSDGSVTKDRERLPALYAAAGVPELWLVDARGAAIDFRIYDLAGSRYQEVARRGEWLTSPLLEREVRLTRSRAGAARWSYRLESRAFRGGSAI